MLIAITANKKPFALVVLAGRMVEVWPLKPSLLTCLQEMREAAEKSAATRKSQQQQPVSQKQAAPGPLSARKPKILPVLPLKRAPPTSTGPQPVAQDILNKVARQGGPPSIYLQQASMASASGDVTTKQHEEGLSGLLGAYGSDSDCDT